MTQQKAMVTFDVVIGIVFMFDTETCMLIDPGAMHSFVSYKFVACVGVTPIPLDYYIEIRKLVGESLWPTQVLKGCLFWIDG